MSKAKSYLPAVIVAVVLGLVGGSVAIAGQSDSGRSRQALPDHSVGWNKLSPGVQKKFANRESKQPAAPIPGPVGPSGARGEQGDTGPEGPSGEREANCELVQGDCLIYGDEFWRLQAALEPFEIGTGEYPEPPFCMKAVAEGESVACAAVLIYLYPDGTLGEAPWEVDPDEPSGWRLL